MSSNDTERELRTVKSKISEAKHTLESAARWEENAENARSYRYQAKQLGIAIDELKQYTDTDTCRSGGDER